MVRRIVSGSGSERTGTGRRAVAALRCERPRGAGGHGSTSRTPRSTARRMHARDTLRNRPAVDGDSGAPSSRMPSAWSTVASTERFSWPSCRLHWSSQAATVSSPGPSCPPSGRSHELMCARSPSGFGGAVGGTSSGSNRLNASTADARVRGAHSGHCSPSHRRAQSCAWISSGSGCHDTGSPVSSSNRSPDC
jgi:hypothetical protein